MGGLFMSKYIFPGADASTPLNWYVKQLEQAGFEVQRVENIGRHYSHTLHGWYGHWMENRKAILDTPENGYDGAMSTVGLLSRLVRGGERAVLGDLLPAAVS